MYNWNTQISEQEKLDKQAAMMDFGVPTSYVPANDMLGFQQPQPAAVMEPVSYAPSPTEAPAPAQTVNPVQRAIEMSSYPVEEEEEEELSTEKAAVEPGKVGTSTQGAATTAATSTQEEVDPLTAAKQRNERKVRSALQGAEKDENGIYTLDSDWGLAPDEFQIQDSSITDTGALWLGLLAGGLTLLGASIAGASDREKGLLFFEAFGTQFGDAMNKSTRYKNVEALQKEGYSNISIEEYIQSGNREVLKKREVSPWTEASDGTWRRTLPDGKVQIKGDPKPKYKTVEKEYDDGVYEQVMDENTGEWLTDEKGLPIKTRLRESSKQASQRAAAERRAERAANNKPSRNLVDVSYISEGGRNYKVSTFSNGDKMREEVRESASEAKERQAIERENENQKSEIRSADVAIQQIDDTIASLEKGNATGPLDVLAGGFSQSTGFTGDFGGINFGNAAEAKRRIEKIQRDLLADVKPLFGPQISNADIQMMLGFDLLDPSKDEAHNIEALKTIRERIQRKKEEANSKVYNGNSSSSSSDYSSKYGY